MIRKAFFRRQRLSRCGTVRPAPDLPGGRNRIPNGGYEFNAAAVSGVESRCIASIDGSPPASGALSSHSDHGSSHMGNIFQRYYHITAKCHATGKSKTKGRKFGED
jgi:hypothetical protein